MPRTASCPTLNSAVPQRVGRSHTDRRSPGRRARRPARRSPPLPMLSGDPASSGDPWAIEPSVLGGCGTKRPPKRMSPLGHLVKRMSPLGPSPHLRPSTPAAWRIRLDRHCTSQLHQLGNRGRGPRIRPRVVDSCIGSDDNFRSAKKNRDCR